MSGNPVIRTHQSVTTKKLTFFNLQTFYYVFTQSNHLLALVSDISIVFYCAAFNTLSTRNDILFACNKYNQQKYLQKSAEKKLGLFMVGDKVKVLKNRVDHTNSIIKPQALID